MDVQGKIKEAEMYYSMGMLNEALSVYEALIDSGVESAADDTELISDKTHRIRDEIYKREENSSPRLSSQEILMIKQTVSSQGGVVEHLDSAAAFRELGLWEEAAAEYEKVLEFDRKKFDYDHVDIIMKSIGCLLETTPISEVVERARVMIKKHDIDRIDDAEIQFRLGLELELRNGENEAAKLFETAYQLDPKNLKIKEKISAALSGKPSDSKFSYLLNEEIVTSDQLQKALAMSKKGKTSVEKALIDHFKIKKEEVGKSLSFYYQCPFKSFDPEFPIPVELIGRLKKAFLIHYTWVPLSWGKEGVEVLVDDPNDLRKTDHIKALMATGKINFCIGIREDIIKFIKLFFSSKAEETLDTSMDSLDTIIPDVEFEEEDEVEEELESIDESSSQVVKFVDQVLITAFRKNVSDIHIEPSPVSKSTGIRFRMDGVCQEYIQVPNIMAPGILSRLKIIANLDIAERRLPQDGKIKIKRKGIPPFELRISTMPTAGGHEDAVLRILAKAGAMKLSDMGLNERNLTILKKVIIQPYGLILVVGPTGSGKTTTLHSALGHINKPEIKIWTAEDPVEITQPGLRQVEAKPIIGLDFSRIMRGFLRLDPDVIMIGEMRDKETASIGVEASLTGHLVFSTLHTNSAPETITRLLDMGLNPLNFSDAFLAVLAQRLVRRVCKGCSETYSPSESEFDEIVNDYDPEQFKKTGITYNSDMKLNRGSGCEQCSGSGYKGRMGIHELMEGTKATKSLIKAEASTDDLFAQAFLDGMATLKQDGIQKVFQGFTDMDEIRRVCIE